ncbi:flavin monoamine oxidase family protein [Paracoccus ravus]|uniref:flavin monoamine oxidase family protein n=1 Tax=Paracoccus ravus TaxID=2447760 RepID=UPI00106DEED3|nr:NAD(P)/FAD-dependent oxidoreductase [Paracoccus ravus]
MTHSTVAVIGGGLAGLNAARLLHAAGIDVQLYEARDRLGGRILSLAADGTPGEDGFDLGPSWFWPRMQPAIAALVTELGLEIFPQASDGDVVFERMSREPAQRYTAPPQEPASLRFTGGAAALIRRLAQELPDERVHLGVPVSAMAREGCKVTLSLPDRTATADHVIAALPPRLLQAKVRFSPALPPETERLWRETPTWMAPHAKVFAIYDRPFWRDTGYSGSAQSMVGPMPEIHDATTASGAAALFGFLGVGAAERARIGEDALIKACLEQFGRIFGAEALSPRATLYKDWAADHFTATGTDLISSGHAAFSPTWVRGPWGDALTLAGSETSPSEPGYLAGAAEASNRAVETLLNRLAKGAA